MPFCKRATSTLRTPSKECRTTEDALQHVSTGGDIISRDGLHDIPCPRSTYCDATHGFGITLVSHGRTYETSDNLHHQFFYFKLYRKFTCHFKDEDEDEDGLSNERKEFDAEFQILSDSSKL